MNLFPISFISQRLVISVFVLLPTYLMAATIDLPRTGETTCYDSVGDVIDCSGTGQDGDIQAGVDWPDPRFSDNGDETITDNLSGLMWTKNASVACDANTHWQVALDYVAGMNSGTNPNYGYTDWRLPNILEMFSLSHQGESDVIDWFTNQGFANVGSLYWTSTTLASNPKKSWTYNFYSNFTYTLDKDEFTACFWPVRAGQQGSLDPAYPANIRKTGQTTCYDEQGDEIDCAGTGQDGEIQAGVTWPDPRFTDNGDGTVKDELTGLNWMQDPTVLGEMSWQESLDYLSELNDAGGGNNRLPNVNEMMSLIDFSKTGSMIPSENSFSGITTIQTEKNLLSPVYSSWTGNTVSLKLPGYENSAYQVYIFSTDYGVQFHINKGGTGPVWPLGPGVINISDDTAANHPSSGNSCDPVNTYSGELYFSEPIDLFLGGPMPLFFQRYYASYLARSFIVGELGDNWRHNFEWTLYWIGNQITVVTNKGKVLKFAGDGQGTWTLLTTRTDIPYQLVQNGQEIYLGDPQNNLLYKFNAEGKLAELQDGKGNVFTLSYHTASDEYGKLDEVTDGLGRTLEFNYTTVGSLRKLTLVQAKYGETYQRSVSFSYDSSGDNLVGYTDPLGHWTEYEYEDTSGTADRALMLRRTLPEDNTPYTQTYYGTDDQNNSGRVKTQKDAQGNPHTFSYADVTNETTIADPQGHTRVHTHSEAGELITYQGEDGQSFTLGYDGFGQRNSIADRLSDTTNVTYHAPSGSPASVTSADETITTYAYTARNHPTGLVFYDLATITYPGTTTEIFVYDASGNITSRTDRSGNLWTFTYDSRGQVLTATNPLSGVTTNTYNADGTLASSRDPAGNTTTYAYDSLKRLVTMTHADLTTRTFTYDNNDNLLTLTDERGNKTTFAYDDNNNLISLTNRLDKITVFAYDKMDRVVSVTDPEGNASNFTYDELGRIKTFTDRNGNITALGYDGRGRLTSITDGADKVWSKTYDAESIIASATDPLSNATTFISDKMGRVTQTTRPLSHTTSVTYDSMGRPTAVEDPLGKTTSYTYDALGLVSSIALPAGISASYTRNKLGQITVTTDPNNQTWQYAYDTQGRLIAATDPLGRVTSFQYDKRNRASRVDLPASTLDLAHDGVGNVTRRLYSDGTDLNYNYDAMNRLTSADGIALGYDANGRITSSNGLQISRDKGGRIVSITLAPGKAITYAYDSRDLLTGVTDWLGGSTTFAYDDAGQVTDITTPNGVNTTYVNDDDGWVIDIQIGSLCSIGLTRDGKGQIKSATRSLPQEPILSPSVTKLGYDAACQVSGFTYDSLGRLISDGKRTYTWNLASQMMGYAEGADTISFTYDARGNRLSRTADGTTRHYVWNYALSLPSVNVMREGDSDRQYYIYTPGGNLIYSIDASDDSRRCYHYDEMGNTLFLTDDTGAVTASYAYGPYGEFLGSTGSADNPFTWQGQRGVMDEGNGLYYMRARYYDSATARFISKDPLKTMGPRGTNPYQYAVGNPLRYEDPTGFTPHPIYTDWPRYTWGLPLSEIERRLGMSETGGTSPQIMGHPQIQGDLIHRYGSAAAGILLLVGGGEYADAIHTPFSDWDRSLEEQDIRSHRYYTRRKVVLIKLNKLIQLDKYHIPMHVKSELETALKKLKSHEYEPNDPILKLIEERDIKKYLIRIGFSFEGCDDCDFNFCPKIEGSDIVGKGPASYTTELRDYSRM